MTFIIKCFRAHNFFIALKKKKGYISRLRQFDEENWKRFLFEKRIA